MRLQAFANGYLWGQLFHRYNLQHDFERFENKRNPDSMVNNYTRLLVSARVRGLEARAMHVYCMQAVCMRQAISMWPSSSLQDAVCQIVPCVQPVFKRLNIAFDSRTANALMREEPGVALRLLYGVKQSLEQVNKDLEVSGHSCSLASWFCSSVHVWAACFGELRTKLPCLR